MGSFISHTRSHKQASKSVFHELAHLKKKSFECQTCGRCYSRSSALDAHRRCHERKPKQFDCSECEKTFSSYAGMLCHQRYHMKRGGSGGKRFPCEECGKVFTTLTFYYKHQRLAHTEETPANFKCEVCGKCFSRMSALHSHQQQHPKSKAHPCPDCEKTYSNASGLYNHRKSCHAPTPTQDENGNHRCELCSKSFRMFSSLLRHQSQTLKAATINTTDLKYKCKECERSFAVVGALNFHKRIHVLGHKSKVKPKLKFQVAANPEEPKQPKKVEQTTKGQFCCPECGRHLQGDPSMTVSIEEVPEQPATSHSKSEVIPLKKPKLKSNLHQCPHCDMSFLKVRGLRAHKWQAHSQGKKVKSKGTLAESRDSVAINTLATKENELVNESKDLVTENKGTNAVGRRKKSRPGFKSIPCVDCGKRYSSSGALYNHKKICGVLKQEVNPGIAEVVEEEPSPPTRLYEQTIKCLFKCDKCGKAFPTEEQLGTHKDLEKSRPHSCALCCRGYWTETQLQQHLAWHDEVRRRLPTELRYRLSASVSTGPAKLNVPLPDLKAKSSLKPLPTPPSRPQNSHKCQHCGKAFLSPGALHKHEAQHDSDGSYRCSLCPRTFSEIRDLIDHHQECMGDDKGQRDPYTARHRWPYLH
ncbi:unnamed protein product [Oncorhynchus mykiss]|uniref:C2H2-type domain-containing protein n=1 Tax=Oncorhynchus mykiss TaxID=8022 RepID=A0A060WUU8_ONCMY|nr:unnamed protein product [Oncorhynchus mykiss]